VAGDNRNKFLRQRTPNQHLAVVDAIEKGDAEQAEKEMKKHIRYSLEVLLGL
jgi:DNA-binding GntR family transcriptional regulator